MEKVLALLLFRARVKGGKWAWKKKKKRKRIGWAYTHAHVQGETNIGTLSYALPETNGRLICSFAQCHA